MYAQLLLKSILGFLVCLPIFSLAQQQSSDEAKVLALEKKWNLAYKQRDISELSSMVAEDFIMTVEDGSTYGKAGYISYSANPAMHVEVAEYSEIKVHLHGNVAIVTGAYNEESDFKGKHNEYRDRFTDVWLKIAGKWQIIASQYSVPLKQSP
jgi:ketosteroid isomerase-like protein